MPPRNREVVRGPGSWRDKRARLQHVDPGPARVEVTLATMGHDGPRLFGSLDSFLPPVPGQTLAGRGVANHQFLLALMRHGSFEGYHFFLPTPEELRAFRSTFGAAAPGGAPITSLPRRSLVERLDDTPYTVFHLGDHVAGFQALCSLRNERAAQPFPITALLHDISDQRVMQAYLAMGLAGPRTHDAIICSSASGREVIRNCFHGLIEETRGRIQPPLSFPMRLPVLPLGVDTAALAAGDRVRGRSLTGIPIDHTVLLYVGRFSAHDKMDLFPLMHVMSRLLRETGRTDLTLLLAGSRQGSPYVDMLKMLAQGMNIADRVQFVVDFDEESKPDIYAAADIYVSPCDNPQETFGLTVVEAMAAGLPVVVSDFDGYRDIVPPYVGARIPTFVVGHSAELSDMAPLDDRGSTHLRLGQGVAVDLREMGLALSAMVSNPAMREAKGKAAARHAQREFDWANVIPQFEALWDELLAEALAVGPDLSGASNPVRMDYARVFAHYPTRTLREDERFGRTGLGDAFLQTGRYPIYAEMTPVLDVAHVRSVVAALDEPASFRDLIDHLAGQSVDVARARRTVLWALKHGLIDLVG